MKFIKGRQLKGEKGFTLMELMVVTLILAVVAAYGIPRYLSGIHAAKLGMVAANYDAIASDTASAYYDISITDEEAVAKKVGEDNYGTLKNPFGDHSATRQAVVIYGPTVSPTFQYCTGPATWASYNGDGSSLTGAGGEVVINYSTSGQITVTGYDDSADPVPFGGYSKIITDPK